MSEESFVNAGDLWGYAPYPGKVDFSELLGKTIDEVYADSEEVSFRCGDVAYVLYHSQDCCEDVTVEDICGDLGDLIGSPVVLAEEVNSVDRPPKVEEGWGEPDSYTWTFYKIGTIKGVVTIRWYGESNGYYSESVDFAKVKVKEGV